jgi:hypothetical protein
MIAVLVIRAYIEAGVYKKSSDISAWELEQID